jgi:osmotically inducible protein OsmC
VATVPRAPTLSSYSLPAMLRVFSAQCSFVATQGGPKVPGDANVKATVGIGPRAEGGFGLEVGLAVYLPGLGRADAETLVQKAHQICPYSNATRNSLNVRLDIIEAQ